MKKLIRKAVLLTTILSLSFCISIWAANRTLVSQQVYTDENGEQMRSLKYSDGSTDEFDLTVDDYLVSEKDEDGIRYSTYANGDTSNVYIDQINEYSSFTKQYGPIIKGCDFAKDESGQKIVDADGSRYISKIRFMEKAGGGEIALDKSEYLKVGKYDHFRLIALKYSIPIRFKDGIYTEWMADRDNGFKGKLVQTQTDEKYEKEKAKKQAEAKADQQQIDLNNQINAELNMNASTLPYTSDFLADYCMKNAQNSQEKLLASFDNERNYVQQYLDKNGFKSITEFYNKIAKDKDLWDTGYDREGQKKFAELQKKYKPLEAARTYVENMESGKWPSDLSYGDYLRKYLKEGGFDGWRHINVWRIDEVEQDYIPTIARGYTSKGYKTNKNYCVVIEDMYNNNVEVAKMIEADLPIIASYTHLSRYARTSLAFNMIKNSAHWISPDPMVNIKNIDTGMTTSKLIDKWVEEYLPNIKESEIALNHDEREKDNDLNDLLDPHNWKYDYETNTVKKTNKWKH